MDRQSKNPTQQSQHLRCMTTKVLCGERGMEGSFFPSSPSPPTMGATGTGQLPYGIWLAVCGVVTTPFRFAPKLSSAQNLLDSLAGTILQQDTTRDSSVYQCIWSVTLAMSPEKRVLRVISSYPLRCDGVDSTSAPLQVRGNANVSFTVYEDGTREVGCSYLHRETHTCRAKDSQPTSLCIHLYPVAVRVLPETDWSRVARNGKYKLN